MLLDILNGSDICTLFIHILRWNLQKRSSVSIKKWRANITILFLNKNYMVRNSCIFMEHQYYNKHLKVRKSLIFVEYITAKWYPTINTQDFVQFLGRRLVCKDSPQLIDACIQYFNNQSNGFIYFVNCIQYSLIK